MLTTTEFGRTGHHSTRLIFGAAALGGMSQERADATLQQVREAGINHIDTAASYGASEDRLEPWLSQHRHEVFLATKTGERTGAAAREQLERSLVRMGVESVDLIQLHNLVEPDEWDAAFGPDGAVAALAAARDEGLVGHIGVTGHGLRIAEMHRRSLERFDFASVLLPLNFVLYDDPTYRSDFDTLAEMCADRGIAVQTIKSISRGRWQDPGARRFSWYEPLTDHDAIARAVRWVLAFDRVFLNTSSDARLLEPAITAATTDGAVPTSDEMRGDAERFGITPLFDGRELERI